MTNYVIRGGKPLFGEVEISGFKNAAVLKNLFRKTYGMSMRDYRKSHRAAEEQ